MAGIFFAWSHKSGKLIWDDTSATNCLSQVYHEWCIAIFTKSIYTIYWEKRVFDHCDNVSYHSRAVVMITVSIIVLLILFIGII